MLASVTAAPHVTAVFECDFSAIIEHRRKHKAAFERELEAKDLRQGKESKGRNPKGPIVLTDCGSVGFCSIGTAVLVYPEGVWYAQVTADDVPEIIEEHLIKGNIVKRLALIDLKCGHSD